MSFNIKVEIFENTPEEHKKIIEENLYDGVIRMGVFPRPKMEIELISGAIILIEKVLVLQMFDRQECQAKVLVSYWEPK